MPIRCAPPRCMQAMETVETLLPTLHPLSTTASAIRLRGTWIPGRPRPQIQKQRCGYPTVKCQTAPSETSQERNRDRATSQPPWEGWTWKRETSSELRPIRPLNLVTPVVITGAAEGHRWEGATGRAKTRAIGGAGAPTRRRSWKLGRTTTSETSPARSLPSRLGSRSTKVW